jgi:hypothetical protein
LNHFSSDSDYDESDKDCISSFVSEDILTKLRSLVDTDHNCGYVTLIKLRKSKEDQKISKPDQKVFKLDQQVLKSDQQIRDFENTKEGESSGQEPKNGKMIPENANLVNFIFKFH